MKRLVVIALILVLAVPLVHAGEDTRDVVHLKNGSIIKGKIIDLVPSEQVRLRTSDGSIFVFDMDDVLRIDTEAVETMSPTPAKRKDPFGAAVMSLLIPGLGQYYNGQVGKGLTQQALVIAGALVAANGVHETSGFLGKTSSDTTAGFGIGLAVVIGTSIWSIWDAHATAERINNEMDTAEHEPGLRTQQSLELNVALGPGSVGFAVVVPF